MSGCLREGAGEAYQCNKTIALEMHGVPVPNDLELVNIE